MDFMHVNVTYVNAAHVKHNTSTIIMFVKVTIFVRVNRCIQLGVLMAGPARSRPNPPWVGLGLSPKAGLAQPM